MSPVNKVIRETSLKSLLFIILSLMATLSLYYVNAKFNFQSNNVFISCLLFTIFLLLSFIVVRSKQLTIVEIVFASFISLICNYSYVEQGMIFVPAFIGFAYIFFLLKRGLDGLTSWSVSRNLALVKKKTVIIGTVIFFVIAWSVYIFAYYPGIGFYDSLWQLSQFYGYTSFSSHHPLISSVITGILTYPGSLINSDILFFSYIFLQLVVSLIFFTYVTYSSLNILQNSTKAGYVDINAKNLTFYVFLLIVFSFIPIYPLYSLTFIKDVLYTIALCFCIIVLFKKYHGHKISSCLFGVSLFIVTSFRNEGIFIALTIAIIFIIYTTDRKNIAKRFAIFFAAFFCINTMLGVLLHVNHGSPIEMFALPDQQIAREVRENPDSFTDDEIQELNKMLVSHDYTVLGEKFNTESSDYVKIAFDSGKYSRKTIIGIWARHFVMHPATFFAAALDITSGYYNPLLTKYQGTFFDSLQWFNYATTSRWKKTFNLPDKALQPSNMGVNSALRTSLEQGYAYVLNHKAISWILSPATYVWIFLGEICVCIEQRKYKLLLIFIPLLLVCGMCILAPVNGSMRYALPIIYSSIMLLPLIAYTRQLNTDE